MPEAKTKSVRTAGGRQLCVEIAGADGGPEGSVLVHNGTPNCRHLFAPWMTDAESRGIQLISSDRPGYGGSTASPGHTVADGAAEVTTIADALGIDRLAVWGLSGGGPYALACAALLPDRVTAVGTVGSVAPFGGPGLDFFAGMGKDNVDDIQLYLSDPDAARTKSRQDRDEAIQTKAEDLTTALETLLSPTDAAVLNGDFAEWLVECARDGLASGDQGWWDDGVVHLAPWGLDFDSIHVPVKIWHGGQDRFVPFQHGQWLAEHVPGAEAELSESDGHLTLLISRFAEVHDWLLSPR